MDPTDNPTDDWRPLGKHMIRVCEDVLFMRVSGTIEIEDVRELVRLGATRIAQYGYHLSVVDATNASTMTAEARRHNAQWMKDNSEIPGSSVVFGAGILARTITTMINRATSLLAMRPSASHFAKDEADALAWVKEERARLQARAALRRAAP